jgi:1-acyl-sn-glycerol-3-phosphate acyltransferase
LLKDVSGIFSNHSVHIRAEGLLCLKPEGTRSAGKPELKWYESVEEGLKKMGVRNWRRN